MVARIIFLISGLLVAAIAVPAYLLLLIWISLFEEWKGGKK